MLQRMLVGFWALLSMSFTGATQAEEPLMSGLFVDHAVLQRDRPLHIYGQAKAGEEVSVSIAGAFGVWLFYVQHCFEEAYWVRRPDWDPMAAAVDGSSFYDLPPVLRWITCNIGYHHIHHLAPRIPNYYLRAAYKATPRLLARVHLRLRDSLACARMKLWDENLGRMVAFPR